MAISVQNPNASILSHGIVTETDKRAMSVATALFFMVGFLTCLNDVIIPHLKSIFELNYAQALLVQFAFSRRISSSAIRVGGWWSGWGISGRW